MRTLWHQIFSRCYSASLLKPVLKNAFVWILSGDTVYICKTWSWWECLPVLLFKPKYRPSHPEQKIFSFSRKIFSGSKYPKLLYLIWKTEALMSMPTLLECLRYDCLHHVWALSVGPSAIHKAFLFTASAAVATPGNWPTCNECHRKYQCVYYLISHIVLTDTMVFSHFGTWYIRGLQKHRFTT